MKQTFEIEFEEDVWVAPCLVRGLLAQYLAGHGGFAAPKVTEITTKPISMCLSERKALSDETLGNCARTHVKDQLGFELDAGGRVIIEDYENPPAVYG